MQDPVTSRETNCDAVLLDISLPDMSGVDVLKQIHAQKPHLPLLILSVSPKDQ